jgi:hypothetical protein
MRMAQTKAHALPRTADTFRAKDPEGIPDATEEIPIVAFFLRFGGCFLCHAP